jgi:hypothetical protein
MNKLADQLNQQTNTWKRDFHKEFDRVVQRLTQTYGTERFHVNQVLASSLGQSNLIYIPFYLFLVPY